MRAVFFCSTEAFKRFFLSLSRFYSFCSHHFVKLSISPWQGRVSLRVQSEFRKMRTRKTRNTNTFYALFDIPAAFAFMQAQLRDWFIDLLINIFRKPPSLIFFSCFLCFHPIFVVFALMKDYERPKDD